MLPIVTSDGRDDFQGFDATRQNPTAASQQTDQFIESCHWIGCLLPQRGQQQISEGMSR
jgi:hypothetical protein